jgi:protein deglycase
MTYTADVRMGDLPADNPAYDMIALPGGVPGADNLRDSAALVKLVKAALSDRSGPIIGAICAAPAVVLAHHDLLRGRKATGYPAPAFLDMLGASKDTSGADVVVSDDGKLITSRGPATAMAFALALVEALYGADMKSSVADALLFKT